jgi:RNA polymerase sigma-70 factor (ECF subfamily)
MRPDRPSREAVRRALELLAADLRPELHRYAARLVGSALDGEDVVQDAFARALDAVDDLPTTTPLRPWLFRIAHNRAIDLLRRAGRHRPEPIEAADSVLDLGGPNGEAALLRRETVELALGRWAELPLPQRATVILKDVLGESLADIASLLGVSPDAVKAHLARGRARLRALEVAPAPVAPAPLSPETQRFAELFNQRDWPALRGLLAHDVRLRQSHLAPREGAAEVGQFFSFYDSYEPVRLVPARAEGREVLAVFEAARPDSPAYLIWLSWREGRIARIRDTRYVRYVMEAVALGWP